MVAGLCQLPLSATIDFTLRVLTGRKRSFRYFKPGFCIDRSSASCESASVNFSILLTGGFGVARAVGQPSGVRLPRR